MPKSHRIPDPIHGTINAPDWLIKIENIDAVRRMMFIRQLGLKAYIDFPGAIHTRYAHVLGAMHLAGKMVDMLAKEQGDSGRTSISNNLKDNKNTIMTAAFLHDIAHGPFSHSVDYVLKTVARKSHEELSGDIIPNNLGILEDQGIPIQGVVKIINNNHKYPFISQIINSQLDADKLDYLLRDAHNVGYRYSFDLDHFLDLYTVIGNENDFSKCLLGLKDVDEAIVTAEIFVLIWKSMYDLVYHIESSRIAEKMLEKATLCACQDHSCIKDLFLKTSEYVKLHDDMLLSQLEKIQGYPAKIVDRIKRRTLFKKVYEIKMDEANIKSLPEILAKDQDEFSDKLSKDLCSELGVDQYSLICDIVKTRSPKKIHINCLDDSGEPIDIISRSKIIPSINAKSILRIYSDPNIETSIIEANELKPKIQDLLEITKA